MCVLLCFGLLLFVIFLLYIWPLIKPPSQMMEGLISSQFQGDRVYGVQEDVGEGV